MQATRYRQPARVLHWLMALIVICMVPLGIAVNYLPWDGFQDFLFNLHKSLGIVVLALVVIRLIYRLTHKPPALPSSVPALSGWRLMPFISASTPFSSPCRSSGGSARTPTANP